MIIRKQRFALLVPAPHFSFIFNTSLWRRWRQLQRQWRWRWRCQRKLLLGSCSLPDAPQQELVAVAAVAAAAVLFKVRVAAILRSFQLNSMTVQVVWIHMLKLTFQKPLPKFGDICSVYHFCKIWMYWMKMFFHCVADSLF